MNAIEFGRGFNNCLLLLLYKYTKGSTRCQIDFSKKEVELDSVAVDGFSITPNSEVYFANTTRAIYVGVSGNVEVRMLSYSESNTELLFIDVQAGTFIPVRATGVLANTTASGLLGLY